MRKIQSEYTMAGKKYGRLTIIKEYYLPRKDGRYSKWYDCWCDCGNKEIIHVRATFLTNGYTLSCGCLWKESFGGDRKYNTYDLTGSFGIGYASNDPDFKFYFDLEDISKIKELCWNRSAYDYMETTIPKDMLYLFPETKTNSLTMANCIMNNFNRNVIIDHINRLPYDNRKENFRIATILENNWNRKLSSRNTSGVIGVSSERNGWRAYMVHNHIKVLNKYFPDFEDAVVARLTAEKKFCGEYASQKHLFENYGI